jgi:hypothetical protein
MKKLLTIFGLVVLSTVFLSAHARAQDAPNPSQGVNSDDFQFANAHDDVVYRRGKKAQMKLNFCRDQNCHLMPDEERAFTDQFRQLSKEVFNAEQLEGNLKNDYAAIEKDPKKYSAFIIQDTKLLNEEMRRDKLVPIHANGAN